jgi:hypothetical protein
MQDEGGDLREQQMARLFPASLQRSLAEFFRSKNPSFGFT